MTRRSSFYGGVCRRGIYENMKTGWKRSRWQGAPVQPSLSADVLAPLGRAVACSPASCWEKGQSENQVGKLRDQLFRPKPRVKSCGRAEMPGWEDKYASPMPNGQSIRSSRTARSGRLPGRASSLMSCRARSTASSRRRCGRPPSECRPTCPDCSPVRRASSSGRSLWGAGFLWARRCFAARKDGKELTAAMHATDSNGTDGHLQA